ncbi:MAG: helix-turn-helix domain-containing protein [Alphaproteobacteria bacterium]|nr:helix-turn-helix domain-containing protein [Alphaproteobacteria bacterium]
MKSVLIECRHLGREFKLARKTACIPMRDAAKMLGFDRRTLAKYENGKLPMPDSMTQRLAHYGYILLRAKHLTDTRKK